MVQVYKIRIMAAQPLQNWPIVYCLYANVSSLLMVDYRDSLLTRSAPSTSDRVLKSAKSNTASYECSGPS